MDKKYILKSLETMDTRKMFDAMRCRGCGRFPSPYYRFICEDSHLLCAHCVKSKFEVNGVKCLVNLEDPRNGVAGAGGSTKGAVSKSEAICQKSVDRWPADPVYTAFFNLSMWKCPGTVEEDEDDDPDAGGCTATLKGQDLFKHLKDEHCLPNQQHKKRKFHNDWEYTPIALEMHKEQEPEAGVGGMKC